MKKNQKNDDLLKPSNTPSSIKSGKELSKAIPILMFLVFGVISTLVIVGIMRRGNVTKTQIEEVEIINTKAPVGLDEVGEIEAERKEIVNQNTEEINKELNEIKTIEKEIKVLSQRTQPGKASKKNIYWEKYKEILLASKQSKLDRFLAAVRAPSTIIGGGQIVQSTEKATINDVFPNNMSTNLAAPPPLLNKDDFSKMTEQMLQNQLLMAQGGGDQNMQSKKASFFNKTFNEDDRNYLPHVKVKQQSKYELQEGSMIDLVMISGINSDLPGKIIAKVSKDTYDSTTGKLLLIPAGTKAIGEYSSIVSYAQDRVALAWTRLIFPNGDSINIGNMGGYDQEGYSGLNDQVDNHYFRLFGQIAFVSFFQAIPAIIGVDTDSSSEEETVELIAKTEEVIAGTDKDGKAIIVTLTKREPVIRKSRSSTTKGGSQFTNQWKESYGQTMSQVGVDLAKKNMAIQPTLKIRPGFKFKIIVTQDLVLPPFGI